MKLIAAVDKRWGIGCNNDLLFKLKEDLAFFKRITTGHDIVMGYRTFKSLPGENGLPNRMNYVITDSLEGLTDTDTVKFITEVPQELLESDAFLIGGAYTYGKYIDYVTEMYLTHIFSEAPHVDTYMPNGVIEKAIRMNSEIISQHVQNNITFYIKRYY